MCGLPFMHFGIPITEHVTFLYGIFTVMVKLLGQTLACFGALLLHLRLFAPFELGAECEELIPTTGAGHDRDSTSGS